MFIPEASLIIQALLIWHLPSQYRKIINLHRMPSAWLYSLKFSIYTPGGASSSDVLLPASTQAFYDPTRITPYLSKDDF